MRQERKLQRWMKEYLSERGLNVDNWRYISFIPPNKLVIIHKHSLKPREEASLMKERGKKRFCAYCGQSLDEYCDCLRELALAEEEMIEELETDPLTQYGWYQQDLIDWRRSER